MMSMAACVIKPSTFDQCSLCQDSAKISFRIQCNVCSPWLLDNDRLKSLKPFRNNTTVSQKSDKFERKMASHQTFIHGPSTTIECESMSIHP